MNKKINLDLMALKFILLKNRQYFIAIAVILFSIFVFFQFIIPQFNVFLENQEKVREETAKLEILKKNLEIIKKAEQTTLDSQFGILAKALPMEKDATIILYSIYLAAQKTGSEVKKFSFTVGDIRKTEKGEKFPVIKVSVPIKAGVIQASSFIDTINNMIPLSQTDSISVKKDREGQGDESTIGLSFYYKLLDVSNFQPFDEILPVSKKGLSLIDKLSGFENVYDASASADLSQPKSGSPLISPSPGTEEASSSAR